MTTTRRASRQLHVGGVPVGGGAPVSVQSMTTTKTADVDGTLAQVYALAGAGADLVRITSNHVDAAQGLAEIVPRAPVPIIADIHFQYRLALAALEAGVAGLRLNPGNIRKPEHIKAVAVAALDAGTDPGGGQRRFARQGPAREVRGAVPRTAWSTRPSTRSGCSRRSGSTTSRSR